MNEYRDSHEGLKRGNATMSLLGAVRLCRPAESPLTRWQVGRSREIDHAMFGDVCSATNNDLYSCGSWDTLTYVMRDQADLVWATPPAALNSSAYLIQSQ